MFDTFKNNWKISVIETGSFKLDGGAMMGSVPKVLWEKTNPCDDLNRIDLSMRCLLLDNGKDKILVETDSPYLSPDPLRGKTYEPCNIIYTLKFGKGRTINIILIKH